MPDKILISACLMGLKVRYNGSEKMDMAHQLSRWQQEGRLVIHCPELAAGLPVPRAAAEILQADGKAVMQGRASLVDITGQEVTGHYQLAAWMALRAAQEAGCTAARLTDRSPTCGSSSIYDGSFSGRLKPGMGVAAALLSRHGIQVFAEHEINSLAAWIAARDAQDLKTT